MNGNVYVTGEYALTADFAPTQGSDFETSAGLTDAFLWRLEADGDHVWVNSYGSTGDDSGEGVTVDTFGNVIATGGFSDSVDFGAGLVASAGGRDIYLLKTDSAGAPLWSRTYGAAEDDIGRDVVTGIDDAIYSTGHFTGTVDFGSLQLQGGVNEKSYALQLDATGGELDANQTNGPGGSSGFGIATDQYDNLYTTGDFSGTVDFDPDVTTAFDLTSSGGLDMYAWRLTTVRTISGRKFIDLDGDTFKDAGDLYENGWEIELVDAGGTVVATTFTVTRDIDGNVSASQNGN